MKLDDRFFRSSRAEEQRKRTMQMRAEERMQKSMILQKMEQEQAEEKADVTRLFCLWMMMDNLLRTLEEQRYVHAPKLPYDDWDDEFCEAVEKIHDVKEICNELWFAYINADRPEFIKYM